MHEIDKIEYLKGMFCEFLCIFYNILSCGVFSESEADGNFLTRVSGSEKYSIFRPVGINTHRVMSIDTIGHGAWNHHWVKNPQIHVF